MPLRGFALLASVALAATTAASAQPGRPDRWVTLGTQGGPIANPERSQPANALVVGDATYLVDAGDGVVEQLAKAGIPLPTVKAIVLSHLHLDHTAGMLAVLGLRWQTSDDAPLVIYGPPGTRVFIDGLFAAMKPTTESGYGMPGAPDRPAGVGIKVVEIEGGARVQFGQMTLSTVKNTHYSFPPGSPEDKKFLSLSLRFDLPDRSIVYTGDTGPSRAVENFAKGADLLIAEMIDVDRTMALVRSMSPNADPRMIAGVEAHLRTQHLTPDDVGDLAAAAHVKSVVITHFTAPKADKRVLLTYVDRVKKHFSGPVVIANDLQEF